MRRSVAEVSLSLGVLALGIGVTGVTATLPSGGGYAGIGPNFIPGVVGAGIILLGIWLAFEAFTDGWRNAAPDDAAARGEHAFHGAGFAWISAGLFIHMALIGWAGFVVAGVVLFACVARGFGSARLARDLGLGLVLSVAIYAFFVKLLNVNLPAGWLAPLLGTAGV
ncbi:MAG: tripartite tricarboxylate transporter TctB family protein [Betaproteobacteria bacterium]|nr:tripartite tricarboxylate transporter TctB family protein [Betaproteobacteria bacterium]